MADLYTYEFGGRKYKTPNKLSPADQSRLVKEYDEAGLLNPEGIAQEEASYSDNLQNQALLNATRLYANNKEGAIREDLLNDDRKTLDYFYEEMRDLTLNTSSVMSLGMKLRGDQFSEEERQAIGLMYNVWDSTVPFYREQSNKFTAIMDFGEAVVTDWFNWAGLLTGGYGTLSGQAAKQVAQAGIRKAVAAYAGKGFKWGAFEGATIGAAHGHFDAEAKEQIGIGEGSSIGHIAKSAAIGGIGGSIFGGGAGALTGLSKGIAAKKAAPDAQLGEAAITAQPNTKTGDSRTRGVTTEEQAKTNVNALENRIASRLDGQTARQEGLQKFKNEVVGNLAVQISKNEVPKGSAVTIMEKDFQSLAKHFEKEKLVESAKDLDLDTFVAAIGNNKTIPSSLTGTTHGVANYINFLKTAETYAWQNFKKAETIDKDSFIYRYRELENITAQIERLGSKSGRELQALKGRLDVELASDKLNVYERAALFQKLAQTSDADAGIQVIKNMQNIKVSPFTKGVAIANDIFVHNILGAWSTIAVNTVSSAAHQQYRILQRLAGGVVAGDAKAFRNAVIEEILLLKHFQASLRYFVHALNTSRGSIAPYRTAFDAFDGKAGNGVVVGNRDMSVGTLGRQEGESVGMYTANIFGNLNRLLGRRLMISSDEFMKQGAFRATVDRKLINRYLDEGDDFSTAWKKADEQGSFIIQKHIEDMANNVQPVRGSIAEEALEEANIVTFQNQMSDDIFGFFGKLGQRARNHSPILTQLLPFVRTPTNLMTFVGDRTPVLQAFSKDLRARLNSPNPQIAAEANAALGIGTMLWAGAFMMAGSGMIQGGGSTDRNRSNVENMSDEYLPYSVNGVAVRRLDPAARFIMVAGAISDTLKYGTDQEIKASFGKHVFAATKTILEIPTLQGLKSISDVINPPAGRVDQAGQRAIKGALKHLQGYMPYYRLIEEIHFSQGNDIFTVENRDIMSSLKGKPHLFNFNNTEYQGKTDLRRNVLDGKPVNKPPAIWGYTGLNKKQSKREEEYEGKFQEVVDEMRRIGLELSMPVAKQSAWMGLNIKRLEFTEGTPSKGTIWQKGRSYYDYYQELIGTIKNPKYNDKTLVETLHTAINDNRYFEIRDPVHSVEFTDTDTKATLLKSIITEYRTLAAQKVSNMLQGHPEFEKQRLHHAHRTEEIDMFFNQE
ncbi:MAG: hypothetical protein Unbinned3329contig1000_24 [Prokaryotic dsDNA virus sp.]|jgi:hypothetical protein|nr:MAG: hypothetical protein Unbinned3329contig1000_24 [Prokaryotic dsDNA virus sp.]|tara:strand:- start:1741 stop:5274 length:3534 start_codon:yes stop_codon:yes gene_type:complete